MSNRTIGIIINGATGRIGSTQHLANALVPIRDEGGLAVGADRIVPKLLLVGRDKDKLSALAARSSADWSSDLDAALSDPAYAVFCDTSATHARKAVIEKAIAAGKHVYSEKPVALSVGDGLDLLRAARARGVRHGAVEDKLYLPGLAKLSRVVASGSLGRVVGFRLDFGWWIFDGVEIACQRPSWNYRKSEGGGLFFDMYPHWRYVLEGLLGPIRRLVAVAATATPERVDEQGRRYKVDVEDTAHVLLEMESGAVGMVFSSWATRVRRDDLIQLQIDGTKGSALAGLHRCFTQHTEGMLRTPHVSVAKDAGIDYREGWTEVEAGAAFTNPYRVGWESFLRHLHADAPMAADFAAGIRDVQLAEACLRSVADGAWVGLPKVTV
jgi:predicted dehydrogenase